MKKISVIIFALSLLFSTCLYSQNLEKPKDIDLTDFNNASENSKVLFYRCSVFFPYRGDKFIAGAKDTLFDVRAEVYLRILLNKNDSNCNFLICPKEYDQKPKFRLFKFNTTDQRMIISKKIKDSELEFVNTEIGLFLNLTSFKKDNNAIIDIKYAFTIKSKEAINFYLDANREYKDGQVEIDIPEIYKYSVNTDSRFIIDPVKKEKTGPFVGFRGFNGSGELVGSYWVEHFGSSSNFQRVECKLNSFLFQFKENCFSDSEESMQGIINLVLEKINEIP